ncbi:hypothetical protein B5V03_40730 [Bradyrhizobium betae]|uniref:Uncharacterized protein n=1 Tax=Bradyrhizobium betae TaxID=244734 RepID=A0A4Q1UFG4_9BRAD|nr:hypothetical protein B5V03_40730 [Bradyrhizobium betae]
MGERLSPERADQPPSGHYFDPVPGVVDGALAGPAPEPVAVGGFVELVVVAGALVWLDAIVWLPML